MRMMTTSRIRIMGREEDFCRVETWFLCDYGNRYILCVKRFL